MREHFHATLVSSGGYARETAEEALESGMADLIAFGRSFTANPDLVEKLRTKWAPRAAGPQDILLERRERLHRHCCSEELKHGAVLHRISSRA
jgi:2,4-dienoyl-CoA reductase-like NADH-dependent reductase (Old Yellow Enzyme family)